MPFPFTHGGSLSWLWTAASGTSLPAGGPAGGDPLQLCTHRDASPYAALPLQYLLWGTDTSAQSHPPKPLYRESADGIRDPLVDLAQRPRVLSPSNKENRPCMGREGISLSQWGALSVELGKRKGKIETA